MRGAYLGLTGFLVACAAPGYHVEAPSPAWTRLAPDGQRIAFHHADGGTIAANVTCDKSDDVPLDVLTNHLLFGIEERREEARVPLTVDGRGALQTRLGGKLDGVTVALELVVLKKDGCTYDLLLIAKPSTVGAREPEFRRFVTSFSSRAQP